ncbi:recombinase family protein [Streptomyces sp. LHD-70]|uniref:recombinase family protein n=1 Tax=Streptomyces sp. LHD-70 TaxID=3072140 RepID=UPI0028109822|nr:recombinase family protein [Streptomyces sp. LHD-70]MDQ8705433.1 recombinase family protein [Streptomyces sp. LHD-70]
MPRLAKLLRVPTPADRGPWAAVPRHPGAPAPADADTPGADICIGYARCSTLTQERQSQLGTLAAKSAPPRDKIVFAEKISTRVQVRPKFEAALAAAR